MKDRRTTKRLVVPGDDDRANGGVCVVETEDVEKVLYEGSGEGVEDFGSIEGDDSDAICFPREDRRLGHVFW